MSIRLMHLADLHLGAPLSHLGEKAATRSQELESAFVRALEMAPEKEIHAVVIAGDLFDSFDPPRDLVARVRAAFEKVNASGIAVILLPGTHDSHRYSRCVYRQAEFPGVDVLMDPGKPILKNLNGRDVYFYGFSGGRKKDADATAFRRGPEDGLHVALVHGPVLEAAHWGSSPRDFPLSRNDIEESGFDYVALGHYHNFREFRFGKTTAVYPGTLEGLKFGEEGDRYLVTAEINDDGVIIEKTSHNSRALAQISIDLSAGGIESADELVAAVEKQTDPEAILKVVLRGATDFIPAPEELESRLSERFFHVEISDDTTIVESGMIRSISNESTVRGIFARKMLKLMDESGEAERPTAELALRLGMEKFIKLADENN